MSENPAAAVLGPLVGLMAIGAIGLAFVGFDPTIATDMLLPVFVLAVFVAIVIGLFNAASG